MEDESPPFYMGGTQGIYNPLYQRQGFDPTTAFLHSAMPDPMYGTGRPPRYDPMGGGGFGGGGAAQLFNQFLPMLMPMLMGKNSTAGQVFPDGGFYHQMQAKAFYEANQQAMQLASGSDTAAMSRTIGGITQLITGETQTDATRKQSFAMAQKTAQMMPFLTQILGPDLIDSLHGSRGSATVFANQMHSALRTSLDPVTGAIGMSGESAGRISQGIYENLFGENYNPASMHGMSAGQAGMLARELQVRGLLGVPTGNLSVRERMSGIPEDLSDETYRRIARNTKEIRDTFGTDGKGDGPTADQLDTATQKVRDTATRLRDRSQPEVTADDLEKLPGGEDLIRTSDANRITGRLKNLSGAVKAMRDIFGDMGNPNAPMREIVDGLNRLTQGGLASMTPGDLEMTVRKTQEISKQTGTSVEAIMAMTDRAAQMGDALGLNRKYATNIGQKSALYGSVVANTINLGAGIHGQVTPEEAQMNDLSARVAAAGSPAANQMNAVLRMRAISGLTVKAGAEGDELRGYLNAIDAKNTEYDYSRTNAAFIDMLQKGSDTSAGAVQTMLDDRVGNQRYGMRAKTDDLIRGLTLRNDAIRMTYGPGVQQALNSRFVDSKAADKLLKAGVIDDKRDFQEMLRAASIGIAEGNFAMDPAIQGNDAKRQAEHGKPLHRILTAEISAKIMARNPGMLPDAAAASATAIVDGMIRDAGGMQSITGDIEAGIGTAAAEDPTARTAPKAYAQYSTRVLANLEKADKQAEISALMSRAHSGFNAVSPLRRVMDFTQKDDVTLSVDAIGEMLGGVSKAELARISPNGLLTTVLGLNEKQRVLSQDPKANYDKLKFNADLLNAINQPGDTRFADEFMSNYKDDERWTKNTVVKKLLEQAADINWRGSADDIGKTVPKAVSGVSDEDIQAVIEAGDRAEKNLGRVDDTGSSLPVDDSMKSDVDTYFNASKSEASRIYADKYAMRHLGAGSEKLVSGLISDNEKLDALVKESKGTLAELRAGAEPNSGEARRLMAATKGAYADIQTRYGPSVSSTPTTAAENIEIDSRVQFDTDNDTIEKKQEAARKALMDILPSDDKSKAGANAITKSLEGLLQAGEGRRATAVHSAVIARKGILQLALKKKLFGADKTEISQLTEAEQRNAEKMLEAADSDLTDEERTDFKRQQDASSIFDPIDAADNTSADARVEGLRKNIEALQAGNKTGTDDKTMHIVMSGSFEEVGENGRLFDIRGRGDEAARALINTAVS